jgi:hypothetical protein
MIAGKYAAVGQQALGVLAGNLALNQGFQVMIIISD